MDFLQLLSLLKVDANALFYRFSGNESLAKRFLLKFPDDKTYARLTQAVTQMDAGMICDEAHALKGIALNLGLNDLGNMSSELVEMLRKGNTEVIEPMYAAIADEYARVIDLLAQFPR